jgi:hypothetical protein
MFTQKDAQTASFETLAVYVAIEVRGKNKQKSEGTSSKGRYLRSFGCTTINACASDVGL